MTTRTIILLFVLPGCLTACTKKMGSRKKNAYAIADFPASMRPFLEKKVTRGIVGSFFDSTDEFISGLPAKELKQLSCSEHPVLRAEALRERLKRNRVSPNALLMEYLDDTATILVNHGEWGYKQETVADDMLYHCEWPDAGERKKIIDEVIFHHNRLQAAYEVLPRIEPEEKYYRTIKQMVLRDEFFSGRTEFALHYLGLFGKKEDLPLLDSLLYNYCMFIGYHSFELMQKKPDERYFRTLRRYYRKYMNRVVCSDGNVNQAISFATALAAQRTDSSATLIREILAKEKVFVCSADEGFFLHCLAGAIEKNPCPQYNSFLPFVKKYKVEPQYLPIDPVTDVPIPEQSRKPRFFWVF